MASIAFKTLGGEGKDIVLIHGFGSDRLSWLANSPALMTVGRVYALDLPGHGDSSTEIVTGSMDELADAVADVLIESGMSNAHLVGHSLGGGIAILIAARHPDLVASLTMIAPAGLGTHIDQDFLSAFPQLADVEGALTEMRRLVARPQLINKMTAQRVMAQLSREGARDALARIAAAIPAGDEAIREACRAVAARGLPRLVIWGEEDRINPIDDARVATFGGERQMVPQTGHLPHIENFKAVNDILCAFIAARAVA